MWTSMAAVSLSVSINVYIYKMGSQVSSFTKEPDSENKILIMLHLLLEPTVNSEWQTNCLFLFTLDIKD